MANREHVDLLKSGGRSWNAWREENSNIRPALSGADLTRAQLSWANLRGADLSWADLSGAELIQAKLSKAEFYQAKLLKANLYRADLTEANLRGADLSETDLRKASLRGAILSKANLQKANLRDAYLIKADLTEASLRAADLTGTDLSGADLVRGDFFGANLRGADLSGADLRAANLRGANLSGTDLSGADLKGANLQRATLVDTDLKNADLTGCRIYGVSAWGLKLEGAKQQNLLITPTWRTEPEITVDHIEVAQFIYLLLHNEKIRDVIDTVGKKAVLILGRFTEGRKAVLDALREELRKRDYLPILFDFEKPVSRSTDETITLLARMARFVIADISDAKSVLQELRGIVPDLPSVPVQPIILGSQEEPGMFDFFRKYPWFLPLHRYETPAQLIVDLGQQVIAPAEAEVARLRT
jgi:uncharacterized protein YjbI with pentapeptide repeats